MKTFKDYFNEDKSHQINQEVLYEASVKINTRTWDIHKATVPITKQQLLVGSNAKFAERVVSIVKQEATYYGWKITYLLDDGDKMAFEFRVKELDVSMV